MTEVERICIQAKNVAPVVAGLSSQKKNEVLFCMADCLRKSSADILAGNDADVRRARENGVSESIIDRLMLNEKRINELADAIEVIAEYDDPVGNVLDSFERPNGMKITKVSVPMGVIGVIYEARPNVTTDVASLIFKAGSAVILRGSASALESNKALVKVLRSSLRDNGLDENIIQLIEDVSHDSVSELAHARDYVDLIIPRGGASLIRSVVNDSSVPVIETGLGNCHIYIDEDADYTMAERIVINAKTQRPSVCNAVETLLVNRKWAEKYLINLLCKLKSLNVLIHGCENICAQFEDAIPATEKDWAEEYLDYELAVKIVGDMDEAMNHISKYSTKHTETIITENIGRAERFLNEVDAAAVNHNVSGRMTDGGMYGFGAEIGISTQKLHARGPMGLKELTSYKYRVTGNGQIRE